MYVRAAKTFLFVILKFLEVEVAYIPIEKNGFWVKIMNIIVVVVHTCVLLKSSMQRNMKALCVDALISL